MTEIQSAMGSPGFWDDQESAQKTTGELSSLNGTLKPLLALSSCADDLEVLLEFAEEDDTVEHDIRQQIELLMPNLEQVELKAMMGEPEDACGAYLKVQAGEGGTDAADWAEMLLRMYARWAELKGFRIEELDLSAGEEAGIRNATISIKGDYVFGSLKGEVGNHRLVRISPFDSAGRRQTSFAAVDLTPIINENLDIEINFESEVREDTYRASGAGGQHVNKTDSAVRLTHLPTVEVVQCQNQRSQHKNRAEARKMLSARLFQIEKEKRDAELAAKRGAKSRIGFGGETIRHYVLHPEQYVKDTRSGLRTGQPTAILNGEHLDEYIEAYLRWAIAN
ncbi:MAG: peptide chain release factor 2 [Planctomycetes bacterium]|nr:peptide chain release factor 2 [Planctomycetota bacterium]